MTTTAALVLAAGASRRLGRPKQLVEWRGRPLLEGVVDAVRSWPVATVAVVLGAHEEEILEAVERFGKPAVVPKYRYQRGNPVLVARYLWPRLMSLEGDSGASRLLQAHPEWVHEVRFDQPVPRDLDTPDDVVDFLAGR